MNPTKYFIYARKSTDDTSRQVRSIEDQIAELRELSKRENLEVVQVLTEKQTAKVPGRPVFADMIARIEKGEASGILAWHPDRLARNSLDGGRIIYLIDTGALADLKFPTFQFDPSATGKFMLAIMFGQSKYYVDNLSENIKRGQRRKLAEGIWPMVAAVGYLNNRSTKTIYPDPVRSSLVREVFKVHSQGTHTLDETKAVGDALGLRNRRGEFLSRSQYHRLLTNPIYCGLIEWSGETHEGAHEPLITKDLFDQVQAVIRRRSKPRRPKFKPYLYRGVFRCGECGAMITTETQKGHNYLRCTKRLKRDCSEPYVREEVVQAEVARAVGSLSLEPKDADDFIAAIRSEQESEHGSLTDSIRSAQAEVREIDGRLSRLTDAYLAQALSLEEYRESRGRLVEEKTRAKDRVSAIEQSHGNWFEPAIRFISAAKQASFLAESGSDTERRDFLRKTGSNLRITNRALRFEPRDAWKLLAKQADSAHIEQAAPMTGAASPRGESRLLFKRWGGDSNP